MKAAITNKRIATLIAFVVFISVRPAVGDSLLPAVGSTTDVYVGFTAFGSPYSISNGGVEQDNVGAGLLTLQAKDAPTGSANNITYSNVTQVTPGTIASFCIDLTEDVGPITSPDTFRVVSLANAPNTAGVNGTALEMGATKAKMISQLWAHWINTTGDGFVDHPANSDPVNAAFQLAIWEIIYETAAGPLNISTGNFFAAGGTQIAGAVSLAQTMLDWVTDPANASARQATLVALSAPTTLAGDGSLAFQDQLVELPEPMTIVSLATTLAAGVICCVWSARRRVNSSLGLQG